MGRCLAYKALHVDVFWFCEVLLTDIGAEQASATQAVGIWVLLESLDDLRFF